MNRQVAIDNFVAAALDNKARQVEVYMNQPAIDRRWPDTNRVKRMPAAAAAGACLAKYRDELGNVVALCWDGITRQYLRGERIGV